MHDDMWGRQTCCLWRSSARSAESLWKRITRAKGQEQTDKTYEVLLDLYASEDVIEDLMECKLMPEFAEERRDDLEFYIPQLCNFLLYREFSRSDDLLKCLLECCRSSFYFSHRMFWFLNSTNFGMLEQAIVEPNHVMKMIELVSKDSHPIYLGNSTELYGTMLAMGLVVDARSAEDRDSLRQTVQEYEDLPANTDRRLDPIGVKAIPLQPFSYGIVADGYMSTICFVEELTHISSALVGALDKRQLLTSLLRELNKKLPAAVYLPLARRSARECAVLHIPVNESKIFVTKERAPFLICVEVYEPFQELKKLDNRPDLSEESFDNSQLSGYYQRRKEVRRKWGNRIHAISDEYYQKMLSDASLLIREEEHARDEYESPNLSERDEISCFDPFSSFRQTISVVYNPEAANVVSLNVKEEDKTGIFKESAHDQAQRLRQRSPFGHLKTWRVVHLIVKSGDDLRQEQLVMQMISLFKQIFREKQLPIWLRPYEIVATGPNCGLIECVTDAMSIDSIKRNLPPSNHSLFDFFLANFGPEASKEYKQARKAFAQSLAGYSLVCFILQIKDRHNGNILLDRSGHVIHIDFGFVLSNSPGGNIGFEAAPFKLSDEFVAVLGGPRSSAFKLFRKLCVKGFSALKENSEKIVLLVEMLRNGIGNSLPCFTGRESSVFELRQRLQPKVKMSEADCREYINRLINDSLSNWRTRWYDRYQYWCQGIF